MDAKDTTIEIKRLSQDVQYYNNVFKKAEKISSVIFYILSFKKDDSEKSLLENTLAEKSFKLHETSLNTLQATKGELTELIELRQAFVSLSSTLQVAAAGRLVPTDMVETINEQIDSVQRYLTNHYLEQTGISIAELHAVSVEDTTHPATPKQTKAAKPAPAKRQQRVAVPEGDISSDAYLVYSQLNDRASRIKTVLEAKPQATVKDVAEIITDVSEKTIQRDLNSLIEKGQVVREGERRWSKYSVVKD